MKRRDDFFRRLKKFYDNRNQLELPFMSDAKSKIDSFFDKLDDGMDKLEGLRNSPSPRPEPSDLAPGDWGRVEKTVYHRFPDDGFQTACDRTIDADDVDKRGVPLAGGVISVCTTCLTNSHASQKQIGG